MCQLFWEEAMLERLHDSQGFNTSGWIFNMKNRFGWKDKIEQKVEHQGEIKIDKQDEAL